MTPTTPAGGHSLLTGAGPAAIAIIHLWGPAAATFVASHLRLRAPGTLDRRTTGDIRRAALLDEHGQPIDDCLVSVHADGPAWDLRLHLHGNPVLVHHCARLLEAAGLPAGAAPAALWVPADALEADALDLLPRCTTQAGVDWLLAQPALLRAWTNGLAAASAERVRIACDELLRRAHVADWFFRPVRVVLAGAPNVGKSALVNALTDRAVSLVAPAPGTTRDWVEAPGESHGYPVIWLDTAGLRDSTDPLEQAGMARTAQLLAAADAVVYVVDVTAPEQAALAPVHAECPVVAALNKADLADPGRARAKLPPVLREHAVAVSAERRTGLEDLQQRLWERCDRGAAEHPRPAPFCPRQVAILQHVERRGDSKSLVRLTLRE